jgi:hypothetical protein
MVFVGAVLARGRRTVTSWIRAAALSADYKPVYTTVVEVAAQGPAGAPPSELNPDYSYAMEGTVFERGLSDCSNGTSAVPDGQTRGGSVRGDRVFAGKATPPPGAQTERRAGEAAA